MRMGYRTPNSAQTMMDTTVFVVDADEAARDTLTSLLRTDGLTCRAYASAATFLAQLRPEQKGCIIIDVRMPGVEGIALINRLQEIGCRIPMIVIARDTSVSLAIEMMKAGVQDFIEKPFSGHAILQVVRQCLERNRHTEAEETQRVMIERRRATLTRREQQVLAGIMEGWANKVVGLRLGISPRTVEGYRAKVMSKMQAETLAGLVRMVAVAG